MCVRGSNNTCAEENGLTSVKLRTADVREGPKIFFQSLSSCNVERRLSCISLALSVVVVSLSLLFPFSVAIIVDDVASSVRPFVHCARGGGLRATEVSCNQGRGRREERGGSWIRRADGTRGGNDGGGGDGAGAVAISRAKKETCGHLRSKEGSKRERWPF